ncbi:MAG: ATP phosphoribosyltransferase [Bacteroidales bacterium]|nr:ATP phosphoribosyltransferase [Bacteroidales bacterium]
MKRLKIAIQKSGRLNEGSLKLLSDCGIFIDNGRDQLMAPASNFPLEVLFLRNSDIPQYVEDGVADAAIIGDNILMEKPKEVEVVQKLGFSRCRVSLAVPKNVSYSGPQYFQGRKIATSYPNTLTQFLKKNNVQADIHEISGSVEIAPKIGLADGICDIVSSGSTLFKNGLKEVESFLKSEAVLIRSKKLDDELERILERLVFRISSVLEAKNSKYILMNVPNEKIEEVTRLLPVLKSPTVMPLAMKGWSSLHTVIKEDTFWEVIDRLKEAGAQGILVIPIEKMVV